MKAASEMGRRHSPTAAERHARDEARAEQLTKLHEQLTAGVAELVEGDSWKAMLTAAARFHTYSWRNCLLILAQMPHASRVAGYRTWQSLGRQVRKGERGIAVIAPVSYRRNDDEEKAEDDAEDSPAARRIRGWKIEHVFDISQTDGEPLPEIRPTILQDDGPSGVWDALADQVAGDGFQLLREAPQTPGALGEMNQREQTVRVRPGLPEAPRHLGPNCPPLLSGRASGTRSPLSPAATRLVEGGQQGTRLARCTTTFQLMTATIPVAVLSVGEVSPGFARLARLHLTKRSSILAKRRRRTDPAQGLA